MNKLLCSLVLFLGLSSGSYGQNTYTLFEIVRTTRTQSPAWKRAETRKENNYWQYKTYLSDYSPQLALSGTLPNYQQNFNPITQEDGSIVYRKVSQNNVDLNIGLTQSIGKTGGTVFAGSSLNRFDDFENDFTQYRGQPFNIGFVQPILQFNQLAWNRKINPLEYEESQKAYFEELEQISLDATQFYFNLMLAQIDMQIAQLNLANNDTIYKIAQGRYQLGKIAENELLQLELNLVNSQLAVSQGEVDLQNASLLLKSFVGIPSNSQIVLTLPEEIPDFEVDESVALSEALKNKPDPVSFNRRVLEAEQELARAKGTTGVQFDLFAQYGVSQRGASIGNVYDDPISSQLVRLEMDVPIIDWGRAKSRKKRATANLTLTEYQVDQDKLVFEQEVVTDVRNFTMLRKQVAARKKSDEIALQAYNIAYQLYLIGKISVTDLNQSLASKDSAKRAYIQSLRDFWTSYFMLRFQTLYDFENDDLLLKDVQPGK
jgi:outer membrane protein TolC